MLMVRSGINFAAFANLRSMIVVLIQAKNRVILNCFGGIALKV
jgi:hypothetical protein